MEDKLYFGLSEPLLSISPVTISQDDFDSNISTSFEIPLGKVSPNLQQLLSMDEPPQIKVVLTKKGENRLYKMFKRMCKQYKKNNQGW